MVYINIFQKCHKKPCGINEKNDKSIASKRTIFSMSKLYRQKIPVLKKKLNNFHRLKRFLYKMKINRTVGFIKTGIKREECNDNT